MTLNLYLNYEILINIQITYSIPDAEQSMVQVDPSFIPFVQKTDPRSSFSIGFGA